MTAPGIKMQKIPAIKKPQKRIWGILMAEFKNIPKIKERQK